MQLFQRKRLQWNRVLFVASALFVCFKYQHLSSHASSSAPWTGGSRVPNTEDVQTLAPAWEFANLTQTFTEAPAENLTKRIKIRQCIFVDPDPLLTTSKPTAITTGAAPSQDIKGEYPADVFSVEQRQQGWVLLHIFGMIYVFVALAIVCDEFFVPALSVITDTLQISEDVAGATFMAAGGSAPELFTSLIGVFISHSNVGIGTIVGSAVFNILFVIGTCALFSRQVLKLTWWPLFRDVSFYMLDLIMLILFFLDNVIVWWESVLLLSAYALYVLFMKWNVQVEVWVKRRICKKRGKVVTAEDSIQLPYLFQRESSSASLHNSSMRTTIFQLMIHTLDALGEAQFKNQPELMNHIQSESGKEGRIQGEPKRSYNRYLPLEKAEEEKDESNESSSVSVQVTSPANSETLRNEEETTVDDASSIQSSVAGEDSEGDSSSGEDDNSEEEEEGETDKPLNLKWPETRREQATYLFLLPIVAPLWFTIPDVRNRKSRKYFVLTFLNAITWIAILSYLMVWWAHQVGETIGISEEIMGLTILAAGTSIPDLITSVIVARKGLGDMAVSSSVGSNIFDITMGLPFPWFLYSLFHGFSAVSVSSNGLFCAIVLLFLMLLFLIFSIAVFKWKMNKFLGFTMFALYFIFLIVSVLLEDRILVCPISI
uniref:Sodium/potassium/calcium exchanger 1 n=1 Tax=Geotrypetes seraphini TaxID=260995 RepID=A0A6P8NIG9_GEOSA|nr:sodium/potassium/calcium exchanger 1 [Geotrypetes seraphini]